MEILSKKNLIEKYHFYVIREISLKIKSSIKKCFILMLLFLISCGRSPTFLTEKELREILRKDFEKEIIDNSEKYLPLFNFITNNSDTLINYMNNRVYTVLENGVNVVKKVTPQSDVSYGPFDKDYYLSEEEKNNFVIKNLYFQIKKLNELKPISIRLYKNKIVEMCLKKDKVERDDINQHIIIHSLIFNNIKISNGNNSKDTILNNFIKYHIEIADNGWY